MIRDYVEQSDKQILFIDDYPFCKNVTVDQSILSQTDLVLNFDVDLKTQSQIVSNHGFKSSIFTNQALSKWFSGKGIKNVNTINVCGSMEEVFIGTQELFSKQMGATLNYGVSEPKELDFIW